MAASWVHCCFCSGHMTATLHLLLITSSRLQMTEQWWVSVRTTTIWPVEEEVKQLVDWCTDSNLILNIEKTKEMIINFQTEQPSHSPLRIDNSAMEVFSSIKLIDSLDWSQNTSSLLKQAQQLVDFLRWIRTAQLSPSTFNHFLPRHHRDHVDQLYLHLDWELQGLRQKKKCCREDLWNLSSIESGCHTQTQSQLSIIRDFAHPHHALFFLLPS